MVAERRLTFGERVASALATHHEKILLVDVTTQEIVEAVASTLESGVVAMLWVDVDEERLDEVANALGERFGGEFSWGCWRSGNVTVVPVSSRGGALLGLATCILRGSAASNIEA